jgi:hypothetical protein
MCLLSYQNSGYHFDNFESEKLKLLIAYLIEETNEQNQMQHEIIEQDIFSKYIGMYDDLFEEDENYNQL